MRFSFLFFNLLFLAFCISANGSPVNSSDNYLALRRCYLKWDEGFYGSRAYFKNILYFCLVDMLYSYIKTDYDYKIENFDKDYKIAEFKSGRWLVIKGHLSEKSIKEIDLLKTGTDKVLNLANKLFAVSGKIVKFRLEDSGGNRCIYLILEDVEIYEASSLNK